MDKFLSIDNQITVIKSKGIIINDVSFAKSQLTNISYYTLINGYGEAYLIKPSPRKVYLPETTFESILGLYQIEQKLRWLLLHYLFEAESIAKNRIIYYFLDYKDPASGKDDLRNQYLSNLAPGYDQTNPRLNKFLNDLLGLIAEGQGESEAIQHYLSAYKYVPLWVLETSFRFGDTRHFYQCCNVALRHTIANTFSVNDSFFKCCLRVLHLARNCCAHRGRLYKFSLTNGKYSFAFPKNGSSDCVFLKNKKTNLADHGMTSVFLSLKTIISYDDYCQAVDSIYNIIENCGSSIYPLKTSDLIRLFSLPLDRKDLLDGK